MSKHAMTVTVIIDAPLDENKAQTALSSALWNAAGVTVRDLDIINYTRYCGCGSVIKSEANGNLCRLCARS